MTVGGIPSTLPTPEYINLATDSHLYHSNDSEKHLNSSNSSAEMKPTKGKPLAATKRKPKVIIFSYEIKQIQKK